MTLPHVLKGASSALLTLIYFKYARRPFDNFSRNPTISTLFTFFLFIILINKKRIKLILLNN